MSFVLLCHGGWVTSRADAPHDIAFVDLQAHGTIEFVIVSYGAVACLSDRGNTELQHALFVPIMITLHIAAALSSLS